MSTSNGEARRWFYVREGRRQGPVGTTRLVDLVLSGEVAEDALVWHSGLSEWLRAQDVEEIRRELPPPVPTRTPAPFPEPAPKEAAVGSETAAEDEAPDWEGAGPLPEIGGVADPDRGPDDSRPRRKRKHRHRDSKRRPAWLWPLAAILVGLMIFLWWLLRRMNEVPTGRIIQTGSLSTGRGDPEPDPLLLELSEDLFVAGFEPRISAG
jgi:hypothetical protein